MNLMRSCITALILAATASAGVIDTLWQRSYNGPSSTQFNQAADIYVDSASSCVYVCGSGEVALYPGTTEMLLLKCSPQGDTLWARSMSCGGWSQEDIAEALAVDSSGNVYIAGIFDNYWTGLDYDIGWAKYDSNGHLQWAKSTFCPDDDAAYDILITRGGGVYICGTAYDSIRYLNAYRVMRVDPDSGAIIWSHDFVLDTLARRTTPPRRDLHPDIFDDYTYWDNCAFALAEAPDGGVVATGFGLSDNFDREWWTMKFSADGDTLWTATHHQPNTIVHDDDVAFDLAVSAAGETYAVGFDYYDTQTVFQGYNFAVAHYDASGVEVGTRSFNIAAEDGDDYAFSVALDDSTPQNVYVTGLLAYPSPLNEQIATFKMTADLTNRWGATGAAFGGDDDDRGYSIFHSRGRVYVAGRKVDDLVVLGYTVANPPLGQPKDPLWTYAYDSPDHLEDYGAAVSATDSDHVYFAGQSTRAGTPPWIGQLTGRLFYADRDLKLDSILAPAGTAGYLDTITPSARIANLGTDPARFTTFMRIGSGYSDSVPVTTPLAPGESTTISFRPWVAMPSGLQAVRCSAATTGDPNSTNNYLDDSVLVEVLYHDAGCDRILAPVGTVDSGAQITPTAWIHNYGGAPEQFDVLFRIGAAYADTQRVTVSGYDSVAQAFRTWTASPRGTVAVACSTMLAGDTVNANDKATGTVLVLLHDVGVVRIDSPVGSVDSGTVATPQAVVRNYGDRPETFLVLFTIGGLYQSSRPVQDLGPGDSAVVIFAPWTAAARGWQRTTCRASLVGDLNPNNDMRTDSVYVRVSDVGVLEVIEPHGTVDSGAVVTPRVAVANYGNVEATFPVWFRIHSGAARTSAPVPRVAVAGTFARATTMTRTADLTLDQVYEDSLWVTVTPGESTSLAFRSWTASPPDSYRLESFTDLTGDLNPFDDTATGVVLVQRVIRDVGVARILAPPDTVDTGVVVVPKALVRNYGLNGATFPVRFSIGSFYSDDTTVTLPAGMADTVAFDAWTAGPVGTHAMRCSTMLAGDMNPNNDFADGLVTVEPFQGIEAPDWLAKLPTVLSLDDGSPNPFRRQITVRYALPQRSRVLLRVYSPSGAVVRTLCCEAARPGFYATTWNGRDDRRRVVPRGLYLCQLEAGGYRIVRKLVKTE